MKVRIAPNKASRGLTHLTHLMLPVLGALMTAACMPLSSLDFDSSQPEMVAFNSCGEVASYLKQQAVFKAGLQQNAFKSGSVFSTMGFVSEAPSLDTGSTPDTSAGQLTFSETNLQEAGVDEADLFKVDGTHAFAIHGNKLVIIEALGNKDPEKGGVLQITGGQVVAEVAIAGAPFEMFLVDNRVIVMTRTTQQQVKLLVGASAADRPAGSQLVNALVYDVTERTKPVLEREVILEGEYLSSRRIGNQVYIVGRSMLEGPTADSPISSDIAWLVQRRLAINSAGLESWLPNYYDVSPNGDGTVQSEVSSVDCTRTYASRATNGDQTLGILNFDVSDAKSPIRTTTIIGDGAVVYASTESIIIALTNYGELTYGDKNPSGGSGVDLFSDFGLFGDDTGIGWSDPETETTDTTSPGGRELTYLHRFTLGEEGDVKYQATGTVPGWILNQFSISEYEGSVRVATQKDRGGWEAESMVFVLQQRAKAGILRAPAGAQSEFLDIVGELRGIGTGEDLYAARFKKDVGYLVTFQEMDPLWVVDLRDPTKPRLRGELWIPGFSTYLHPIENSQLLGVGRDGPDGGIKVSLFDVSDLDWPRAVDEEVVGGWGSESEALDEHRAFRYLPEQHLMMLPMTHSSEEGLYVYSVNSGSGLDLLTRISHREMTDTPSTGSTIRRAYQIGDYFYAYSAAGVSITQLNTLETVATIDLPDAR